MKILNRADIVDHEITLFKTGKQYSILHIDDYGQRQQRYFKDYKKAAQSFNRLIRSLDPSFKTMAEGPNVWQQLITGAAAPKVITEVTISKEAEKTIYTAVGGLAAGLIIAAAISR